MWIGVSVVSAGRMAPNEKDELRLPATLLRLIATLLRIAALAPAPDMDFQSVEMVDIRLSTATENRLRFSASFILVILR